jgi:hypothetical protein
VGWRANGKRGLANHTYCLPIYPAVQAHTSPIIYLPDPSNPPYCDPPPTVHFTHNPSAGARQALETIRLGKQPLNLEGDWSTYVRQSPSPIFYRTLPSSSNPSPLQAWPNTSNPIAQRLFSIPRSKVLALYFVCGKCHSASSASSRCIIPAFVSPWYCHWPTLGYPGLLQTLGHFGRGRERASH